MRRHDVVVVGGGTGGLTAAREANRRGAHTVLVSEGPLGGDCTHTGCVPPRPCSTPPPAASPSPRP